LYFFIEVYDTTPGLDGDCVEIFIDWTAAANGDMNAGGTAATPYWQVAVRFDGSLGGANWTGPDWGGVAWNHDAELAKGNFERVIAPLNGINFDDGYIIEIKVNAPAGVVLDEGKTVPIDFQICDNMGVAGDRDGRTFLSPSKNNDNQWKNPSACMGVLILSPAAVVDPYAKLTANGVEIKVDGKLDEGYGGPLSIGSPMDYSLPGAATGKAWVAWSEIKNTLFFYIEVYDTTPGLDGDCVEIFIDWAAAQNGDMNAGGTAATPYWQVAVRFDGSLGGANWTGPDWGGVAWNHDTELAKGNFERVIAPLNGINFDDGYIIEIQINAPAGVVLEEGKIVPIDFQICDNMGVTGDRDGRVFLKPSDDNDNQWKNPSTCMGVLTLGPAADLPPVCGECGNDPCTCLPEFVKEPPTIESNDSDAEFEINGIFDRLMSVSVTINGVQYELKMDLVDDNKYLLSCVELFGGEPIGEAVKGSIVITLYKEFLATLINGDLMLNVEMDPGDGDDLIVLNSATVAINKPRGAVVGLTANTARFVSIEETAKNSRVWVLTFNVTVSYSNGERDVARYSVNLSGNNANLDGEYRFGNGHDLAGYRLVYDIKGNGSNIKDFRIVK
ncbi:MAG: CBM9 family sugar-binding protein, partial [Oscillospiraceae bacterium]|nr:CBM9 family sugar-binding protein [Oscillospiraceae bacterium]